MVKQSPYRWVVVATGGIMGCAAMGALFALPVILNGMADSTGWSRTGISAAMTVAFLAMAVTAIFWGAMSDRFGAKWVVLAGAVLFSLALFLAGRAQSLLMFQIFFGGLAGGSVAAFFAPMMSTVTGWFTTQTALAVSLVSAGMGLAPVTMSPLAAKLTESHDWRGVLTIMAGIVAAICIPLSFTMRRPPAANAVAMPGMEAPPTDMTVGRALSSPQFLILFATNFFCCATHSGPIFHTVSYAELCGLSTIAAVSIYSVEDIAGMAGRLGFGVMGDRFGAKRMLVIGLLAQAFAAGAYYFARSLGEFYTVAVIFGFIYAGTMPLYSVILRENFPMKMLGTVMGAMGMAGSLGMATGPVVGGFIFDRTGEYGGLYITSLGMGIFAFLIASTFRPFPKTPPLAQPA